jgi:hypothetical protein
MGSLAAPPRLELPLCGRRSGKLESRARRWCVPESSTSSPMRRQSRSLASTTPGVEVTREKLAPRALRRHLIGLGLVQRPELRYPLLPQILHDDGSTIGQPSNFVGIPPLRKRSRLRLGGDGRAGSRRPAASLHGEAGSGATTGRPGVAQ